MATAGVPPRVMGIGPVRATQKLMARLNLKIADFDLVELIEAFAAQALAVTRSLGLPDDSEHVNPNGGAIALGHPLGASGARLVLTAIHQLEKTSAKRALITLCVGVGRGFARARTGVRCNRIRIETFAFSSRASPPDGGPHAAQSLSPSRLRRVPLDQRRRQRIARDGTSGPARVAAPQTTADTGNRAPLPPGPARIKTAQGLEDDDLGPGVIIAAWAAAIAVVFLVAFSGGDDDEDTPSTGTN